MADTDWGTRDSRGEWQPAPELLPKPSPIFRLPWKPWDVIKYLFAPQGFLWPWNLFYAALAVIAWLFFGARECCSLRTDDAVSEIRATTTPASSARMKPRKRKRSPACTRTESLRSGTTWG